MKKLLPTTLTLLFTLILMFVTVSPVGAATLESTQSNIDPPADSREIENLVGDEVGWTLVMSTVSFTASGGARLTFDVTGTPPSTINTLAYAGWNGAYPLNCGFNSNRGVLVCRIDSGIKKHKTAYFVLGGQSFTISTPNIKPAPKPPSGECAATSTFKYFDFFVSNSASTASNCLSSPNPNL